MTLWVRVAKPLSGLARPRAGGTHLDMHVGAVISITGKLLATQAAETTAFGYLGLLNSARSLGDLYRVGVESTATYGCGLTNVLHDNGIEVFEVNSPDRASRRVCVASPIPPTPRARRARCCLPALRPFPKSSLGPRTPCALCRSPAEVRVKARTQAINQMRGILVSASQDICERLLRTKAKGCVNGCARIRSLGKATLLQSLSVTLRILAKRWLALRAEIKIFDGQLEQLTSDHAPSLRK